MKHPWLLAAAAIALCGPNALAQDNIVSGQGVAPIGRDAASVEAAAEQDAKADLVRAMGRQAIGAERLSELTPEIVHDIATQIRSDMIVNRTESRVGNQLQVTLDARIDPAWFRSQLDNEGIASSSDRAGGQTQPIFIMIDENTGAARDYERPSEINTEYDRSQGASYSDKSMAAYAEKDRSAKALHAAEASSSSAGFAAGSSDRYGSAGVAGHDHEASAATLSEAAAKSHSEAAIAKTDVQANDHDDTHFHQTITYQTSSHTGPAEIARPALGSALQKYGVELASSDLELASYFKGAPPTYSQLKADVRFKPFLSDLAQRSVAPFFMGGTITLRDGGRDVATGQPTCSGALAVSAFATNNSYDIGDGTATATGSGATYEDCAAKLSEVLAHQAADDLGPRIQNYWRKQTRAQTSVVAAAGGGSADYTVTFRAAQMSMAMQADILDALSATPGVQSQVMLGQQGGQMSFQVHYAGPLPLQLALFQKLRSNAAFTNMASTVQGQSIVMCISGC